MVLVKKAKIQTAMIWIWRPKEKKVQKRSDLFIKPVRALHQPDIMEQKTCIIVAGPTAVGKTDFAIELALRHKTAILSADSRQCYKELGVGVAKPDATQLATVPHYFINSHSIHEDVTAATFETYALQVVESLFQSHDTVIVCGGTGLYIRAFTDGLDAIPA